jgi:hypothetical protein
MVPLLLAGVVATLMGLVLTVVDHPAVPEIATLVVGIVFLIWADWISKHHAGH